MDKNKLQELQKLIGKYKGETNKELDRAFQLVEEILGVTPKFYLDQPVLVSDCGEFWNKRYFCKSNLGVFYAFFDGRTSSTCKLHNTTAWKFCKPDPDAESIINWISHDSILRPFKDESTPVYVMYKKGTVKRSTQPHGYGDTADCIPWGDVERYFIIPPFELL